MYLAQFLRSFTIPSIVIFALSACQKDGDNYSQTASLNSANTISVKCTAVTIGSAVSVVGSLTLESRPELQGEQRFASGKLKITVGSFQSPDLDEEVEVKGVYDSFELSEPAFKTKYARLGSEKFEDLSLYVDFLVKNESYVEFNGKTYLANCK